MQQRITIANCPAPFVVHNHVMKRYAIFALLPPSELDTDLGSGRDHGCDAAVESSQSCRVPVSLAVHQFAGGKG
jgi:hypothetical protein